jgi:hypothetical protein
MNDLIKKNCFKAALENEYFKEKITEFYVENRKLKEELTALNKNNQQLDQKLANLQLNFDKQLEINSNLVKELQKSDELARAIVIKKLNQETQTTKKNEETSTQTNIEDNPSLYSHLNQDFKTTSGCSVCNYSKNNDKKGKTPRTVSSIPENQNKWNQENKKSFVKLCEMQHSLLKKYEDEVNRNAVNDDLIRRMKFELDEQMERIKQLELERQNSKLKNEEKIKKMKLQLETYKSKCNNFKKILRCFDGKFFDEIEVFKSELEEQRRLNNYYETLLKLKEKSTEEEQMMSDQFNTSDMIELSTKSYQQNINNNESIDINSIINELKF